MAAESLIPSHVFLAQPDAVFRESSQPRSTADIQKRAKKTFDEMLSFIPGIHLVVVVFYSYNISRMS